MRENVIETYFCRLLVASDLWFVEKLDADPSEQLIVDFWLDCSCGERISPCAVHPAIEPWAACRRALAREYIGRVYSSSNCAITSCVYAGGCVMGSCTLDTRTRAAERLWALVCCGAPTPQAARPKAVRALGSYRLQEPSHNGTCNWAGCEDVSNRPVHLGPPTPDERPPLRHHCGQNSQKTDYGQLSAIAWDRGIVRALCTGDTARCHQIQCVCA